jgi:hypothetical protein
MDTKLSSEYPKGGDSFKDPCISFRIILKRILRTGITLFIRVYYSVL